MSVRTRVERGATWLDKQYANAKTPWWDQVRLDSLDLRSNDACVLGQLEGDYSKGLCRLFMYEPAPYGFNNRWVGLLEYGMLTRAWKREIEVRRSKARVLQAETQPRYELVA